MASAVDVARARPARRRRRSRPLFGTTLRTAVLVIAAAIVIYPVLLIVSTALKDPAEVAQDPYGLFTAFNLSNITDAWTLGEFSKYFWNTVLFVVPTVLAVVILSTVAG